MTTIHILLLLFAVWLVVSGVRDIKQDKINYERDMQRLHDVKKAEYAELNELLAKIKSGGKP